jgi:nucleoside-triphosphatase
MKLFLTGEPHSGKSTLLTKLIGSIQYGEGFVTAELIRDGQRHGFELISSEGKRVLFADADSLSDVRVSRYGLNIEALDAFIDDLPKIERQATLYLDEVGQMQLFSERFRQLARQYVDSDNHLIGTISKVYNDDFINEIKTNPKVEVIEVTIENRDELTTALLTRIERLGI